MPLVAVVPTERYAAAGPQDAMELRERGIEIEPMECRARKDHVCLARGDRDRLGRALDPVEAEPLEHGEHPRVGLDRDDLNSERGDRPRQLPSAGSELDDELRILGYQPACRLLRPRRPRALVGVGVCAERQPPRSRRHALNLQAQSLTFVWVN